jgi:hypothetical protein
MEPAAAAMEPAAATMEPAATAMEPTAAAGPSRGRSGGKGGTNQDQWREANSRLRHGTGSQVVPRNAAPSNHNLLKSGPVPSHIQL